jgi:hypothetical protein
MHRSAWRAIRPEVLGQIAGECGLIPRPGRLARLSDRTVRGQEAEREQGPNSPGYAEDARVADEGQ